MRGSASSPSCAACPTTPTIVIHVESVLPGAEPNVMRLPIGSVFGKYFFTNCSSITTTGGDAEPVLVGEHAALLERNAQRLEEAR